MSYISIYIYINIVSNASWKIPNGLLSLAVPGHGFWGQTVNLLLNGVQPGSRNTTNQLICQLHLHRLDS